MRRFLTRLLFVVLAVFPLLVLGLLSRHEFTSGVTYATTVYVFEAQVERDGARRWVLAYPYGWSRVRFEPMGGVWTPGQVYRRLARGGWFCVDMQSRHGRLNPSVVRVRHAGACDVEA